MFEMKWKKMWNKARKGDVINVIQFGLTLQIISFHPSSLAPLLHFCSFMILIATWVLLSFSALSFCFWSQFSSINNKYELTCAYIHSVSVLHWPSKAHKIKNSWWGATVNTHRYQESFITHSQIIIMVIWIFFFFTHSKKIVLCYFWICITLFYFYFKF